MVRGCEIRLIDIMDEESLVSVKIFLLKGMVYVYFVSLVYEAAFFLRPYHMRVCMVVACKKTRVFTYFTFGIGENAYSTIASETMDHVESCASNMTIKTYK